MKIIKGDLVLEKDTTFDESIKVDGDIRGKDGKRFNLTVKGDINALNIDARNINTLNIDARNINTLDINALNINAWNIHARNIDVWNINALDINAWNIDARNIDALDIDARNIVCVSRKKKAKTAKTIAYSIVTDRFKRIRKEVMPENRTRRRVIR